MKTILCYGDSNTYGQIAGTVERYPRGVRWTGILQQKLGSDYYVIEEGLGGRTTVWDDPIEEHKNGKTYLLPCLDSHKPLDLVAIMLGTNDLKKRFSVSSFDICWAMENLINAIQKSDSGIGFHPPAILLITPVPIKSVGNFDFDKMLEGGEQKSKELHDYYEALAARKGIYYLNPANDVEISSIDGVHFTESGHAHFAELVEKKIRSILG
jgi:lysophospholipase L1-like esterase